MVPLERHDVATAAGDACRSAWARRQAAIREPPFFVAAKPGRSGTLILHQRRADLFRVGSWSRISAHSLCSSTLDESKTCERRALTSIGLTGSRWPI